MGKEVPAMPSDTKTPAPLDQTALADRFQTLATKSQAVVQEFLLNRPDVANIGMGDPAKIGQAFFELTTKLMADPRPIARAQIEIWEQSVSLWARTVRHLLGDEPPPVSAPDKRFKHPEWAENAIFSYIRDSYLLFARATLSAVHDVTDRPEYVLEAEFQVAAIGPSAPIASERGL
jgi:polyhydroxyalkanoate synthase